MNKLSTEKRASVISCLVEGNSIRATVRMTGVAKNTVVNDHVWSLDEVIALLLKM